MRKTPKNLIFRDFTMLRSFERSILKQLKEKAKVFFNKHRYDIINIIEEILENNSVSYEEAFANNNYRSVVEDWSLSELGYVIKLENLFRNLIRKITKFENDVDKFHVEDFEKAIHDLVDSTIGHESNKAFDGLFHDMRLQDVRLGDTAADRTDMIGRIMVKVSDIDFDLQDSQFDVLGTAYMILIGLFASNARKKSGEFFTPAGPSRLCATADKKFEDDPRYSGAGRLAPKG